MCAAERLKPAAAYRLAARTATGGRSTRVAGKRRRLGELVRAVLGQRYLDGAAGRALVVDHEPWLARCDELLRPVLEFESLQRVRRVFRPALRVGRQIPAATYELQVAAALAPMLRGLELDVETTGGRRADLRAWFLSSCFHVEVKTHEGRGERRRAGGLEAARALLDAARRQCAPGSANLVVLGCVRHDVVRRLAVSEPAASVVSALAWLQIPARHPSRWRGAVYPTAAPAHAFTESLAGLLRIHLAGQRRR